MFIVSSGRSRETFSLVVCLAVAGVGIGVGMESCLAVGTERQGNSAF